MDKITSILTEERLSLISIFSICIFLFLQPFFKHTESIKAVSLMLGLSATVLNIVLNERGHLKPNKLNKIVAIYALVAIVSVLFCKEKTIGLRALQGDLYKFLAIFFILSQNVTNYKKFNYVRISLLSSGITFTILVTLLNIAYGNDFFDKSNWLTGRYDYAFLMTFYSPLLLWHFLKMEKAKYISGIVFCLLVFNVYLSLSRIAIVSVVISSAILLLFNKRFKILLVTSLLALSIFFLLPQEVKDRYMIIFSSNNYNNVISLSYRYATWQGTVEMVKDRPLLGFGFGWKKFYKILSEEYIPKWSRENNKNQMLTLLLTVQKAGEGGLSHPHNMYLGILFETGLIGLIIFIVLWYKIFTLTVRGYKEGDYNKTFSFLFSAFVGYHILGLAYHVWNNAWGILIWSGIGLLAASFDKDQL